MLFAMAFALSSFVCVIQVLPLFAARNLKKIIVSTGRSSKECHKLFSFILKIHKPNYTRMSAISFCVVQSKDDWMLQPLVHNHARTTHVWKAKCSCFALSLWKEEQFKVCWNISCLVYQILSNVPSHNRDAFWWHIPLVPSGSVGCALGEEADHDKSSSAFQVQSPKSLGHTVQMETHFKQRPQSFY